MSTQVTAEMMREAIEGVLLPKYREVYNYQAAADEANDNAASYGIAEYEVRWHHTIMGRPFVVHF